MPGSVDTHTFGIEVALISDIYYYHQDEPMTVLGLTNESGALVQGYTYGAYGNATIYYPGPDGQVTWNGADNVMRWNIDNALDIGNPYTYTGRSLDAETGLLYHRARYLDPELGRFITGDKIGVWGDPNNLGNKYAYCNNNPTECSDPTGEWGWLKRVVKSVVKLTAVATVAVKNVAHTVQEVAESGVCVDWEAYFIVGGGLNACLSTKGVCGGASLGVGFGLGASASAAEGKTTAGEASHVAEFAFRGELFGLGYTEAREYDARTHQWTDTSQLHVPLNEWGISASLHTSAKISNCPG